ncbi:MAG: hypothetical protein E7170_03735 [Firmicutes bacterium]|nr:hypothetical protein [Bacillota bacterium]
MDIKKYKLLIETFSLNKKELGILLYNYYDSFAFNKYLFDNSHYSNLDFNSTEMFSNLVSHFEKNCVDEDTQKKIVISSPMVFSCEDFDKQLEFVYKDSNLEGIIIIDQNDVKHPYKIKNSLRSITENSSILNDLVISSNDDYKKVYYTKMKK